MTPLITELTYTTQTISTPRPTRINNGADRRQRDIEKQGGRQAGGVGGLG